jgi:UDP:flavonoid glycosyltransferase YjiC (YdhE family)
MRIDILALGSRGDVQPYVALGLGLRSAGHHVRLVTLGGFTSFVRAHGLDHVEIGARPQEIMDTAEGRDFVGRRRSVLGFLGGFVRVARTLVQEGVARYWPLSQDADALVASAAGLLVAVHVAEKRRLPLVRAQCAPSVPTRYDWNGRTSWAIAARGRWEAVAGGAWRALVWQGLRGPTNRARRELLGLPPLPAQEPFATLNQRRVPLLDAYSPAVVSRPPDWGRWIHVTGYWFLDAAAGWKAPAELADFLDAGPPPVFVGFGSTPFPEPQAATRLVVAAVARAQQRAVLVAGGSGLSQGRLSEEVLSVDAAPHDWLFPRVRAAVHQAGAGVAGAALRAGLPSVVVPVFADQPFWAQRIFALGAGPRPIPARRLSVSTLSEAIRCVVADERIRRRAGELGAQIRAEDGVRRAVEAFQEHVA